MAEAGAGAAKIGVWTDYSKGKVLGASLTLTNRDAAVLLAVLATLVTVAGTRAWRFTRFLLYRVFPMTEHLSAEDSREDVRAISPTSCDEVSPEHVIVRNSETATGAAFSLVEYIYSQRKYTGANSQPLRKWTVVSAAAVVHAMLFIACSILTSQVFIGNTVLSGVTPTCGRWLSNITLLQAEIELNSTLEADNYALNCYSGDTSPGIFDCQKLVTQYIPFREEHNASCPFPGDICLGGSAFAMDTGNVSLSMLGINTVSADQLFFRRRTTCAPVRPEPFLNATYTAKNLTTLTGNQRIFQYVLWPDAPYSFWLVRDDIWSQSYKLSALYYQTEYMHPLLRPIDRLTHGAHGTTLILLSGHGIWFDQPYDDLLWSVHTEVTLAGGTQFGVDMDSMPKVYKMDRPLNILGCDERFQICSGSTGLCDPWSGMFPSSILTNISGVDIHSDSDLAWEMAVAGLLASSFVPRTTLSAAIGQRDGSSALQAARHLVGGQHVYLEPEQWKTELRHWFSTSLAKYQLGIFHSIERPSNIPDGKDGIVNMWDGTALMELCGRIKYRSNGHSSLSLLGVLTVVVVSVLLIGLSFFEMFLDRPLQKWLPTQMKDWAASENLALLERLREKAQYTAILEDGGNNATLLDASATSPDTDASIALLRCAGVSQQGSKSQGESKTQRLDSRS